MTQPIGARSPMASYYDPSEQLSSAYDPTAGAGGASASAGAGGSEGTGNVPKLETNEPSTSCLVEVLSVARDCGSLLLAKRVSALAPCALSLAALSTCARSPE
jgi:hypothetical protein